MHQMLSRPEHRQVVSIVGYCKFLQNITKHDNDFTTMGWPGLLPLRDSIADLEEAEPKGI